MNLYITRPYHAPNFKICGADEVLAAALKLQYGKYISETAVFDTYDINVTELRGNILYEIDTIIFENTVFDEAVIALHGSAVEWCGKVYMFLAGTESGKTTLSSYLTSRGYGYITDDCVLITRENLLVHPYTCPVHLRDGGVDVLSAIGKRPPSLQLLDDAIMRRHIYVPANCIMQPLPIGGIYFIRRSKTENKVDELIAGELCAKLVNTTMMLYPPIPSFMKLIARLLQIGCCELIYKDMDFVAETIERAGENV